MKPMRRTIYLIVIAVAVLCFLALAAVSLLVDYRIAIVGLAAALVLTLFVAFDLLSLRRAVNRLFVLAVGTDTSRRTVLSDMGLPAVAFNTNGEILWYNDLFRQNLLARDAMLESISDVLPGLTPQKAKESPVTEVSVGDRHYTAYCSDAGATKAIFALLFDDTDYVKTASEYRRTRPCVLLFSLDNYEDVMSGARDSEKSAIMSDADRVVEDFINSTNGIMRKVSSTAYFAIVEEQHIKSMIENRFRILDDMRKIEAGGISLTLSIGVGRGARTLYENQIFARQSLDMAMGRGGDQAAMKYNKDFTFFGGIGKEVEKNSRIKARTIASALGNIISDSSNVLIMGHSMSDLDVIGSAVGLARIVTTLGVPVNIVVDEKNTMALGLIHMMKKNGYSRIFVSGSDAKALITSGTLLIIVDAQLEARLDTPELLPLIKNVVIIDHHRMMVGHIDRSVLFYHDTHASSCCELVTELLQFVTSDTAKATKAEAVALLAGIMLDTKFFTLRTGSRTFEASAELKKLGADTTEAKKLFAANFDIYKTKAALVSQATIYKGCAIAFSEPLEGELRLAVPQAADDLLNIEGVSASVVCYPENDVIYVSARSLGEYNVQLIMENIGGGGHQTMAGVQLRDCDIKRARELIMGAVDKYLAESSEGNG